MILERICWLFTEPKCALFGSFSNDGAVDFSWTETTQRWFSTTSLVFAIHMCMCSQVDPVSLVCASVLWYWFARKRCVPGLQPPLQVMVFLRGLYRLHCSTVLCVYVSVFLHLLSRVILSVSGSALRMSWWSSTVHSGVTLWHVVLYR